MDFQQALKERKAIVKELSDPTPEFRKKLSPYDFLIQIVSKKTTHKYKKKFAPAFLLLQWFSQDSYCIDIVHAINHLQFDLDDEIVYKYLFSKIPKDMKIPQWIKKQTEKEDAEITRIKLDHCCSTREASMIKKHKERINNGE